MKTLNQIAAVALAAVVGATFVGCSSDNDPIKSVDPQIGLDVEAGFSRSEADALGIAQRFFNKSTSGSRSSSDLTVSYYTNPQKSRNEAADILSYIVNRGDDDGFILVASDKHVSPVLAFSETGHFSYEASPDDPVYTYFLSNLEAYYAAAAQNDTVPDSSDDILDGCYIHNFVDQGGWHQKAPYNKYVVQEYPDCVAGCVAVAVGLVMHYSRDEMTYHNEQFNFKGIREVMAGRSYSGMTKDQAQDKIAKLLYYIGQDVYMSYGKRESKAMSIDGVYLLDDLGFRVNSDTFLSYSKNIRQLAWDLLHNKIVYMHGQDETLSPNAICRAHAWILDGCRVCFYDDLNTTPETCTPEDIRNVAVHCDWGWGGSCNGFYEAEVLNPDLFYYTKNLEYVSVEFGHKNTGEFIIP